MLVVLNTTDQILAEEKTSPKRYFRPTIVGIKTTQGFMIGMSVEMTFIVLILVELSTVERFSGYV